MLFLFLIFGLLSIVLIAIVIFSLITGIILLFIPKLNRLAPFVLLIPTLGALAAIGSGWGLSNLLASFSHSANNVDAWEFWQVVAIWGWPIGCVIGGIIGLVPGSITALVINRRYHSRSFQNTRE